MPASAAKLRVATVQIAELNRPHRQKEQFQVVDGVLMPKRSYGPPADTCFVYLPYSIALLQAHAQAADPGAYEFLLPIFRRMPVEQTVEDLRDADVAAFSVYVWNINLSLKIACKLKERSPNTLIVFGGPQVPDNAAALLREHPYVDLVCHGEGERVFTDVLRKARSRDWTGVCSVSYLAGGECISNPRIERLKDLAQIPSPFLNGIFDPLMSMHPDVKWLALWETNRGCPYSCSFCDWGSAVGSKVYSFDFERIKGEADWFASRKLSHVFICDANFGILKRDIDIAQELVDAFERHKVRVAVSVQGAKNATERSYKIHKIFSHSKVITVGATLSLQSVDKGALEAVRRDNISLGAFQELQQRFRNDGIEAYTDIIVGLPGESYAAFIDGIGRIIESGQHNRIAFYNCSVLPNAEMADPAYRARYALESVPVEIIHEHESLLSRDRIEAQEFLDTVISTSTMPRAAWVRARAVAWLVELVYFNRLAQIPLLVLRSEYGISYRTMFEALLDVDASRYPVTAGMRDTFVNHAMALQHGAPEYIPSERMLGIWWPADQYVLVSLVADGQIDGFFDELRTLLLALAPHADQTLVSDAVALNHSMLRVPHMYCDGEVEVSSNVLECYLAALGGDWIEREGGTRRYLVNRTSTVWLSWESWAEDVVMQEYRRADFLYAAAPIATQVRGSTAPDGDRRAAGFGAAGAGIADA